MRATEKDLAADINEAVRQVCLWFPETEEYLSHGAPNFRVRGKTFASYLVNHHGDGRIALWLNAPAGAQELHVGDQPQHFFIPPYVGPRGWLGVHLDRGLDWDEIAALVREAWIKVAPPALARTLGPTLSIDPPARTIDPAQFDPLSTPPAQEVLARMRELCLALPDTRQELAFGTPVWRAGKKTFASLYGHGQRIRVAFRVGIEMQELLIADRRYAIPAYQGHQGWIALDLSDGADWEEIAALALQSYRHFASKRMLLQLDSGLR